MKLCGRDGSWREPTTVSRECAYDLGLSSTSFCSVPYAPFTWAWRGGCETANRSSGSTLRIDNAATQPLQSLLRLPMTRRAQPSDIVRFGIIMVMRFGRVAALFAGLPLHPTIDNGTAKGSASPAGHSVSQLVHTLTRDPPAWLNLVLVFAANCSACWKCHASLVYQAESSWPHPESRSRSGHPGQNARSPGRCVCLRTAARAAQERTAAASRSALSPE